MDQPRSSTSNSPGNEASHNPSHSPPQPRLPPSKSATPVSPSPGPPARPFHISRATDEITQFPSYEAMQFLSATPNSTRTSTSNVNLLVSLTANVLHNNSNQNNTNSHSSTNTHLAPLNPNASAYSRPPYLLSVAPSQNLSSSTLSSSPPSTPIQAVNDALGYLSSFIPRINSNEPLLKSSPRDRHRSSSAPPLPVRSSTEDQNVPALTNLAESGEPNPLAVTEVKDIARMICLTTAFLGTQLALTTTEFYGIPYLISLDISPLHRVLVWLFQPISSIVVSLWIGVFSDLDRNSKLRRRKWLIRSSLALIVGLAILPSSHALGHYLSWVSGQDHGEWDPNRELNARSNSTAIASISIGLIHLSIQGLLISLRSLIIDSVSADHQVSVNAWAVRFRTLGDVILFGSVLALSHRHSASGQEPPSRDLASTLRGLAVISIAAVAVGSAVTCSHRSERRPFLPRLPPGQDTRCDEAAPRKFLARLLSTSRSYTRPLYDILASLPVPIRRVCWIQSINSFIWFTVLYYSKAWVVRLTLWEYTSKGSPLDEELLEYAHKKGFEAMFQFSLCSLVSAAFIPVLCSVGKMNCMVLRRGKWWNVIRRKVISNVTPRNVWTVSFFSCFVLMVSSLGVNSGKAGSLLVALLGLFSPIAQWVPYALLMEYTRSIEETNMISMPISLPASQPPSTPASFAPRLSKNPSWVLTAESTSIPEARPQQIKQSNELVDRLVSCRKHPTLQGGRMLAIFNLSSVVPHLIVTMLTSLTFNITEFLTYHSSLTEKIEQRTRELSWFFGLTGLISLIAVPVSRKLIVPTSELEYWDELSYQIYENPSESDESVDAAAR